MKTRIPALALAGFMAVALSACASNSSGGGTGSTGTDTSPAAPQPVSLTVSGPQNAMADGGWVLTQETAFAAQYPQYQITWTNKNIAESDAGTQITKDPSSAPNVYMFSNDQLGALIQAKAIGVLNDTAAAQVNSQNSATMIQSVTSGGQLYGVPYTANTWFMYYDKSKVSDPSNLDTILQSATVNFPVENSWYFPAFYVGAGMTLYGADGTDESAGVVLGDKATDVTNYIVNLVANKNFVPDSNIKASASGSANWSADVVFDGAWDAKAAQQAYGANYAAAQLPTFTLDGQAVQMKAFAGSKAIGWNPSAGDSLTQQAAQAFAAFLGSASSQQAMYTDIGQIPSDKTLSSDPTISADPVFTAQNNTIANTSILQPTNASMNTNFWTPGNNFGYALVSGQVTAANAADQTTAWGNGMNGQS